MQQPTLATNPNSHHNPALTIHNPALTITLALTLARLVVG